MRISDKMMAVFNYNHISYSEETHKDITASTIKINSKLTDYNNVEIHIDSKSNKELVDALYEICSNFNVDDCYKHAVAQKLYHYYSIDELVEDKKNINNILLSVIRQLDMCLGSEADNIDKYLAMNSTSKEYWEV